MDRSSQMFFHHTDSHMIPYLGSEFLKALLGLDACDGTAEAPLDLDGAEPPVTSAKMKAQNDGCRYVAQRISTNRDNNSSLPESNRNKTPLSGSADPDNNACCFLDSGTFLITERETLTTPLRSPSVVFSLWDRLVQWLNKHTGARER